MKSYIKEYFTFSRSQQIGVVTLLILIALALIFPKVYLFYQDQKSKPDLSFADNFEIYQPANEIVIADSLFEFDPNKASPEQLQMLGFSSRLVNMVIKYRKAGGTFRQPDDLFKIYNFPDTLYQRVLPYIKISIIDETASGNEDNTANNHPVETARAKPIELNKPGIFELNTIDSTQLVSISGIGPVFARRIINYRQFLGGFHRVSQLKEVYKFPEETYLKVCNQFTADSTLILKMNLNKVEFNQLSKHPYLAYGQTKAILSYRKSMGKYKSAADLLKYKLVDTATYNKIKPYLTVE